MVTIKLKFRPMDADATRGRIVITVSKGGNVRQIKTAHHVTRSEWDGRRERLIIPKGPDRSARLVEIREELDKDMARLQMIVGKLERESYSYTVNDIIDEYSLFTARFSLFNFMNRMIESKLQCGRVRTSETYRAALMSFSRFRNGEDVMIDALSTEMIDSYEAFLQASGVTPNTSSFYMRILRAVYNKAVECGGSEQQQPFRHVYTGVEKTRKRALSLREIRRIRSLDLTAQPALEYARDIFMLSFYTRGMSFVDMAFLRKTDLSDGYITYRRRKTGQKLQVEWTREMQDIIDKYATATGQFLFPILRDGEADLRRHYHNVASRINGSLKKIAEAIGYHSPLTLYCARHSWASAAQTKKIPVSVISAGMGHASESTTRIYLASIDHTVVDRANSIILKALR